MRAEGCCHFPSIATCPILAFANAANRRITRFAISPAGRSPRAPPRECSRARRSSSRAAPWRSANGSARHSKLVAPCSHLCFRLPSSVPLVVRAEPLSRASLPPPQDAGPHLASTRALSEGVTHVLRLLLADAAQPCAKPASNESILLTNCNIVVVIEMIPHNGKLQQIIRTIMRDFDHVDFLQVFFYLFHIEILQSRSLEVAVRKKSIVKSCQE